jgi:hypothetical protein
MHWLRQELFERLDRFDLGTATFLDRIGRMEPEIRDRALDDIGWALTRDGNVQIAVAGKVIGGLSLSLSPSDTKVPSSDRVLDVDVLFRPMDNTG